MLCKKVGVSGKGQRSPSPSCPSADAIKYFSLAPWRVSFIAPPRLIGLKLPKSVDSGVIKSLGSRDAKR